LTAKGNNTISLRGCCRRGGPAATMNGAWPYPDVVAAVVRPNRQEPEWPGKHALPVALGIRARQCVGRILPDWRKGIRRTPVRFDIVVPQLPIRHVERPLRHGPSFQDGRRSGGWLAERGRSRPPCAQRSEAERARDCSQGDAQVRRPQGVLCTERRCFAQGRVRLRLTGLDSAATQPLDPSLPGKWNRRSTRRWLGAGQLAGPPHPVFRNE